MYNYLESIKNDILDYIKNNNIEVNEDNAEVIEYNLGESLWNEDAITGNASGSYFCNAYKAFECLFGNEELLKEAKEYYGIYDEAKAYDWEHLDVSIRCYLLNDALSEAIKELLNKGE